MIKIKVGDKVYLNVNKLKTTEHFIELKKFIGKSLTVDGIAGSHGNHPTFFIIREIKGNWIADYFFVSINNFKIINYKFLMDK